MISVYAHTITTVSVTYTHSLSVSFMATFYISDDEDDEDDDGSSALFPFAHPLIPDMVIHTDMYIHEK